MVEPGTQDLIFLKSARSWNRASNTRCGDTDSLNRVLGASHGLLPSATLSSRPPTSLTGTPNKPRNSFGSLDATTLPARIGCAAALPAVRPVGGLGERTRADVILEVEVRVAHPVRHM